MLTVSVVAEIDPNKRVEFILNNSYGRPMSMNPIPGSIGSGRIRPSDKIRSESGLRNN